MITHIIVDGFKSLDGFELTLKPGLNVLVGPNGSGKTNIISFFEFLAHLVQSDAAEATSRLGGAGAIFRRIRDGYKLAISATIYGCYAFDLDHDIPRRSPHSKQAKFGAYKYSFRLQFSDNQESVLFANQRFQLKSSNQFVKDGDFMKSQIEFDFDVEASIGDQFKPKVKVHRLDALASFFPYHPSHAKPSAPEESLSLFAAEALGPTISLISFFSDFVPSLRTLIRDINGAKTYNIIPSRVKGSEDSAKRPGIDRDGSGLAATLWALKRRRESLQGSPWYYSRTSHIPSVTMDNLLDYVRLANNSIMQIDVVNDPYDNLLRVSFAIKSEEYTAQAPLSFMSDGTLKWLALVTAALTTPSIFSIEEPENYLHPYMQSEIVKILRDMLFKEKRHACSVMTTHSETLLNSCKPDELVVIQMQKGLTQAKRCSSQREVSKEIEKTGFGLGYYYLAGALTDD